MANVVLPKVRMFIPCMAVDVGPGKPVTIRSPLHTIRMEDNRLAAEAIRQHTVGRSLADYQTDHLLRAGIERWFIIIGEALTRLEKLDASWSAKLSDFRKIVGFCHVLVHGYEAID